MIDPARNTQSPVCTQRIASGVTRSQPAQSQSFAAQLTDRLAEGTRNGTLPASMSPGQQIVTRQDSAAGSGSSSAGSAAATSTSGAGSQPTGLNALVINFPSATYSATSAAASGTVTSSQSTPSYDQQYWANQPAAVQQLQNIQDPAQRTEVAEQLAQQGYTIDVPIMVWGWDPATTMAARQSFGYTWVPSALQSPVQVAPGLTYAGNSYNPSNPPAGSIPV